MILMLRKIGGKGKGQPNKAFVFVRPNINILLD